MQTLCAKLPSTHELSRLLDAVLEWGAPPDVEDGAANPVTSGMMSLPLSASLQVRCLIPTLSVCLPHL